MASLGNFTLDRDVVRGGEWVTVGSGENEFEIRTRGFTPDYRDNLARLRREAVRELNRKVKPGEPFYTPDTLPPSVDDKLQGQAMADYCLLDVRGLEDGGQPITVEQFKGLIRDPEGRQGLLVLVLQAAMTVGAGRQAEREVAEGNS